jgi:zinc transporter, ZIP family
LILPSDFLMILAIAGAAAIASPIGGLIALWRTPTTLFMSIALGFASGTLLGTISFEMMPQALQLTSTLAAVSGFVAGFASLYAFDLFIHRGRLAGPKAEQAKRVKRYYRRHRPRGDEVTVLAGGTSTEELIEGLTIGIGVSIKPGLGLLVALAIVIDNMAEALSIGELVLENQGSASHRPVWRVLKWTSLIGVSLFSSALVGWLILRGMPQSMLGLLFGAGAGGMFYLTITDLVPEAEERHYQQSAGWAIGIGFITMFVLSQFI